MPAYPPNRRDPSSSRDVYPKRPDTALLSPVTPAVTGIIYPSPVDAPTEVDPTRYRQMHPSDRASSSHRRPEPAEFSVDESVAPSAALQSIDELWDTIREKKAIKMAKERPKVQSLEEIAHDIPAQEQPGVEIPVFESQGSIPQHALKKQKSISSFRESTDGRSIVAEDIHVSFQRNRLVLTWATAEISEWEEDGCIVRDRLERHFNRAIPMPEGTRFEEIQGAMIGRRLTLRYPNMRCYRIEARSRSGES
ncbi:hypothetical protein BD779DRAFT_1608603 [Infundibulicybe gibba]|nr:hypothetical protein BD779DRAFT_1608603 [Infundibulicybe gibba]